MSVVKKLMIQGIRSFNPNENKQQTIEFQTPLTLIVGVNGSGKTTIIEALKYAITNALPPNCNKGSSFVNDPKVTHASESMGVVKLTVQDAEGQTILTTRKVKVSVKDRMGNLTKKELDPTLRITDKNNVTKDINPKCLDIKTEMCRIMGVSEAILNTVILCHQEDSCWPLDEGKKVKEKFDAIFNTTMYIKCLDTFAKQDKDLGQRAKMEKEKLGYVDENRKIARKKKNELEAKQIEQKIVSDKIESFENELIELETKLFKLQEIEKEYSLAAARVSATEGTLSAIQKQMSEIKLQIKEELNEDISSLRETISTFEDEKETKISELQKYQKDLKAKEDELEKIAAQQKTFVLEEGKFLQEESTNQQRMESLTSEIGEIVKLVKKLKEGSQDVSFSSSMDACMEVCDADVDTLSPNTVVKALASGIRVRESEMTKTRDKYVEEEKKLQEKIDEFRSKRAGLEKEIQIKNGQIKDHTSSIEGLRNRLREIEGSDATLEALEEDESKLIKQISSIKETGVLEKFEVDMKNLAKEMDELDNQIMKAAEDVEVLSNDQSQLDKIAMHTKQKTQQQNECTKIMRKIEDDLKNVLGELPERDLTRSFDKKRDALVEEINVKKSEQKLNERKLTVKETELKRVNTDLEKKLSRVEALKDKLEDVLEGRDFEQVYEDVKDKLEETQKDCYFANAAAFLYKKYIKKFNQSDCCPICNRDTTSKQHTQELIQQLTVEIGRMQENEPTFNADIAKLKKKQNNLLELKPQLEEHQKLENDIPEIKERITSLEREVNELSELVDDANGTLAMLENDKSTLDKCNKDVGLYDRYKKDVLNNEEIITKLESNRSIKAKELAETINLSNAKTQLQDIKNSLKIKQKEKDGKSNMLNAKRMELNKLSDEKNKTKAKILKITSELQNREALETQKKELEEEIKKLQVSSSSIKLELPKIKSEMNDAEKELSSFVLKKERHLQVLMQEKISIEKKKTKIEDVGEQIEEFERNKARFAETKKRATECRKKQNEASAQKKELELRVQSIKDAISNQESNHRNVKDNLSYKLKIEEVSKLKAKLVEDKKCFVATENRGVAVERREASLKHQQKSAKMNELKGSIKEIQSLIRNLTSELGCSPYFNAEKEYLDKLVKSKIYEKAQKDVRRYKTALDQAIMMFHKKRMEMINRSLWEYWRMIYRGNDIDYIQIRTEADKINVPGTGNKVKIDTGKGRKNYNYRVVMIRRGTELDMRGRCSAGQRVLASIIIRIALADSFSSRCGIITLDEPTTNLDQKNINSLADALASLAEKMSRHKNFQLVVITHDQEFTERLSAIDSVEYYFKISRDDEGFSHIKKVPKRG